MEKCFVRVEVGEEQFDQVDFLLIEETVDLMSVINGCVNETTACGNENLVRVFA